LIFFNKHFIDKQKKSDVYWLIKVLKRLKIYFYFTKEIPALPCRAKNFYYE